MCRSLDSVAQFCSLDSHTHRFLALQRTAHGMCLLLYVYFGAHHSSSILVIVATRSGCSDARLCISVGSLAMWNNSTDALGSFLEFGTISFHPSELTQRKRRLAAGDWTSTELCVNVSP